MKLKSIIFAPVIAILLLASCSKDKIITREIETPKIAETQAAQPTIRTNTEPNLKAYIFIETQSKLRLVVDYLKTIPRDPQSTGIPFYACWTGIGIRNTNFRDLNNYLSMPLWTNGVLPKVISSNIPQVSGGKDAQGNPKIAYNFETVKIPKNTVNDNAWVLVAIPVSAMNNDTRRQHKIASYGMIGTRMVSSGNNTQTVLNTNTQLSSYLINYTGSVIPKGLYRIYSTYSDTWMRIKFDSTSDRFLRGSGN